MRVHIFVNDGLRRLAGGVVAMDTFHFRTLKKLSATTLS